MQKCQRYIQYRKYKHCMKIIVASKNPVKIATAEQAFAVMFPGEKCTFEGISVPSGVSDQPMTSEETRTGALNRAKAAREVHPDADYFVGLEGVLEVIDEIMYAFSWNAIINSAGRESATRSATYELPNVITEKIHAGIELGHAANELYKRTDVKHTSGMVGILTNNIIGRTELYVQPTILALIPFVHTDFYQ